MNRSCLSIRDVRAERAPGGGRRISARVGAGEVFFESDTPLVPAREAFLQLFLFPAMCRGLDLSTDGPLCPRWVGNAAAARELARRWWGFSGGAIRHPGSEALQPASGQALFFGGGVDSFYTLWRMRERLTHLVYIEGFDVPLADAGRLAWLGEWNRAVAQECGLDLVVIRSNLRVHRDFRVLPWINGFGGALAAAGHLLRDLCGTAWIAAGGYSAQLDVLGLGMHSDLTPLWSSAAVRFHHHAEETLRCEKVAAIAEWPLARRFLRVCWKHQSSGLNCGVCEKCVRTQLEFFAAGQLDELETMPPGSLKDRLNRIPWVSDNHFFYYQDLLDRIEEPELRRAIQALRQRSIPMQRRLVWRDAWERRWKLIRRRLQLSS
jgi:hypothetical protein